MKNTTLIKRYAQWFCALWLTIIIGQNSAVADGDVFKKTDTKVVQCKLPTHREQTPEQAAAGESGDVFAPSEFSGYNAYLTPDVSSPGNPTWLDDPGCNYSIDFSGLSIGQHYIYFEAVDTEARVSKPSEVYPFEVIDGIPKVIMPPNPPSLVVVGPGGPVAFFGPVSIPTVFGSTPEIKAAKFIVINATLNSVGVKQGLFSRDENGQIASGHTSISVLADGIVVARNQGPEGTESLVIKTSKPVNSGVPFTLALNIGPGGLQLYHDGVSVGYNPEYYPLIGNDLPLVVGGICSSCTEANRAPSYPIDGDVFVEIYSTEMILLSDGSVS